MAKILFCANLTPNKFGSLEEMILFLGRELARRGDELLLAVPAEPEPVIGTMFAQAGIEIVLLNEKPIPAWKTLPWLRRIVIMRRLVHERQIDLVHVNFYDLTDPYIVGTYFSRAKIVYTEHASGPPPVRSFAKHCLSKMLHFCISRRVTRYIAVSEFVQERLRISHHVGPDKSVTIYNGVNIARFAPRDRASARALTSLPANRKIILSVAMLIPEKGINYLIDAAALLINEFGVKDFCLVVAGEGSGRAELEKQVCRLQLTEHVSFLGRRSDVELLVAAADVVVVPAVWAESFGLIIAEAMASGRPVVASRVGGIPELIDDDITGFLVPPGDAKKLAEKIYRVLSEEPLWNRMASASQHRAETKFNLSRQVSDLVCLFDQTIKH